MRRSIGLSLNFAYALFISSIGYYFSNSSAIMDPQLIIEKIDISDCYSYSNASFASVVVEFNWRDLDPTDVIDIKLGDQERSFPLRIPIIDRHQNIVEYKPLHGPQVATFELKLDGSSTNLSVIKNGSEVLLEAIEISLPQICHSAPCNTQNSIGGKVFLDNDGDAVQSNKEAGINDVEVHLISCDRNQESQSVRTSLDGSYSFGDVTSGADYQIVFDISTESEYFESSSPENKAVRFVNGPICGLDLALTAGRSNGVGTNSAKIFVPCYVHGTPKAGSRDDTPALLQLPYADGNSTSLAPASQVGTLWGVAWDDNKEQLYTSAVLRRHAGLGPLGIAGIYTYSKSKGTKPWLDLSFGGAFDFGDIKNNNGRGLSSISTQPDKDSLAWHRVGKVGIGDIDVSADGQFLFVTNLASNQLFKIATDSDNNSSTAPTISDVKTIAIPSPCGNRGNLRPWALKYYNGRLYVGVTCDAAFSGSSSDLRAFIYELNPQNDQFERIVLDFPLSYPRGSQAVHYNAFRSCGNWNAWNDDYKSWCNYEGFYGSPQPILSDIEMDMDGSMYISILDRSAYMLGNDDYLPDGSGFEAAIASAGDVLKARRIGDRYFLENGGQLPGKEGIVSTNFQGPGNGEFFDDSYFTSKGELIHAELGLGGLALNKGKDELLFTAVDPIPFSDKIFSGGIRFQSTINGSFLRGKIVYSGAGRPFLGKSAGLGDIELATKKNNTFEIGDYVWFDRNKNGIQDACEPPIPGVTICLINTKGTVIAKTRSDDNGKYTFSSKLISELKTPGKYYVSFGCEGQFDELSNTISTPFGALIPTVSSESAHPFTDSDLSTEVPIAGPAICVVMDNIRNDYSYDAGFQSEGDFLVDFAIRVRIDDSYKNTFSQLGDTVKFIIEAYNQGTAEGCNVEITNYVPEGLVFNSNIKGNEHWEINENVETTLNCISPGESDSTCIFLIVNQGNHPNAWTNYAEISKVEDNDGNDISGLDVDSKLDGIPANNVGSLPNTEADDYLFGNGSSTSPDGVAATDQDNVDPAQVRIIDVAAILIQDGESDEACYKYGDSVKYNVIIFNQGSQKLDSNIVSVYLPKGMGFDPKIVGNENWQLFPLGFVYNTVNDLAPGEKDTLCLFLTVKPAVNRNDWIVQAEVSQAFVSGNLDISLNDIDSPLNFNPNDNVGGQLNSPADNYFNGNGTALFANIGDALSDQDNADPEEIRIYDLALRKTSNNASSGINVKSGQEIEYRIELHNQGNQSVTNIAILDYGHPGLRFKTDANSHFEEINGDIVFLYSEEFTPDEILEIPIVFEITNEFNGTDLNNVAEITFFTDMRGNDLTKKDADSTPDADPLNDRVIDDEIEAVVLNQDGSEVYVSELDFQRNELNIRCDNFLDEDDHDIAFLPVVDLSLEKDLLSKPVKYGDTLIYIIKVTNEGGISARNVIVTDYMPKGLKLLPEINDGWTPSGSGFLGYTIQETLNPGVTIDIPLTVLIEETEGTSSFDFLNIAEITYVESVDGIDIGVLDIDSSPDADPYNDVSDNAAQLTDVELLNSILNTDGEDDHDPVQILPSDISLRKSVTNDDGPYVIGDDAEYEITITNQGLSTIYQVVIADYPQLGLELSPNDYVGWLDEGNGRLLNVIQGPIKPKESISIPVVLRVTEQASINSSGVLINRAEVLDLLDENGQTVSDFDSEPANLLSTLNSTREDDEDSAQIIFLALSQQQCDSLATNSGINLGPGGNCETKIIPEFIFTGAFIPPASEIDSFGYVDTSGAVVIDSIIPARLIGNCINVFAYVNGCLDPNSNQPIQYWTQICLEDKEDPVITCPPNDTLTCLEASMRVFRGTISDCSPVDTLLVGEDVEELCSGDFLERIVRTWQARDIHGNFSNTCNDTVLVRRLDFSNLSKPVDTTMSCTVFGGVPAVIPPSISGEVKISGMPISGTKSLCNTTALYEDRTLRFDTCKHIVMRTWTINEWRCGKDSIIQHIQLITLIDTVAPVIQGLPDTIYASTNSHVCEATVILPPANFIDSCNMAGVHVDIFTPRGAFLNSNGATVTLPVDTNVVYYNVSDPCHNMVRDSIIVIVRDGVGPLAICQSNLGVDIPIGLDSATVPASIFDISSADACGGPLLRKVRRMENSIFTDSISFRCDEIGDTIMVVLQISDTLGNSSICMIATRIQGDSTSCSLSPVISQNLVHSVSGIVFTDMGLGLPGISVASASNQEVKTDEFGNYFINNLDALQPYHVEASYIGSFSTGVSTLDLIKIQRHILGLDKLESAYREMAADVNGDGKINVLDILVLRKHILGIEQIADSRSWKFMWADSEDKHSIINPYRIESLVNDMSIDFVGVKIGDVTGDAIEEMEASSRSNQLEALYYEIIDIGGFKEISIKANRSMSISGLQTLFRYDPDYLALKTISPALLNISAEHMNSERIGEVALSWHGSEDIEVKKGDVLWRALFEGRSGNEWNYGLALEDANNGSMRSELYEGWNIYRLVLERGASTIDGLILSGNDPNPWENLTKVNFEIPRSGMVELELYDSQNRLIYDKTKIFSAGNQKWEIGDREVPHSGVIYGKISYEGNSSVFKMLKIE